MRHVVTVEGLPDIEKRRCMARIILNEPHHWSTLWQRALHYLRLKARHRIFAAIEVGDDAAALRLATTRTLRKRRGEFGQSPLVAAISEGRTQLVREFIVRGGIFAGDGALAHAAMRGDLVVVQALLDANKDPDEPLCRSRTEAANDYTPLMWATNRKHLPVIRSLLAAGANVDAFARDGSTAVMLTRDGSQASLEALEILCGHQPDIHRRDWRGRNLIQEARDRQRFSGRPEMRQIIDRHFPGTDFDAS